MGESILRWGRGRAALVAAFAVLAGSSSLEAQFGALTMEDSIAQPGQVVAIPVRAVTTAVRMPVKLPGPMLTAMVLM